MSALHVNINVRGICIQDVRNIVNKWGFRKDCGESLHTMAQVGLCEVLIRPRCIAALSQLTPGGYVTNLACWQDRRSSSNEQNQSER